MTLKIKNPLLPSLIGIAGKAGSGKSSVASYLHKTRPNTYTEAFADSLKLVCATLFGVSLDSFYDPKQKETPVPPWNKSPREMAQFVGTDLVRKHLAEFIKLSGANFWCSRLHARLLNHIDDCDYSPEDTVCIPDVRFQDEYDYVISNGGIVIHLTRPGADGMVGIPYHASEAGFNSTSPERTFYVENKHSIEYLYAEVDSIIDEMNIYPLYSPKSF